LFIEGDFEKALQLKKETDSTFGTMYWTPHLLFIESVYYLKQRQDIEAKAVLQKIVELYPDSPLGIRSKAILEVLGRRKQIEEYLTNLKLDTTADEPLVLEPVPRPRKTLIQDSLTVKRPSPADTLSAKKPDLAVKKQEEKPAIKPATGRQPPPKADSIMAPTPLPPSAFSFTPEKAHLVVVILNKVDPVYVTESRNAFNKYNKERFYNTPIEIRNETLNDSLKLVIMSGFENSASAEEYLQKTQAVATAQIIPWMPAGKYSFLLISEQNIEVLKLNMDLDAYRKFQDRNYPPKPK